MESGRGPTVVHAHAAVGGERPNVGIDIFARLVRSWGMRVQRLLLCSSFRSFCCCNLTPEPVTPDLTEARAALRCVGDAGARSPRGTGGIVGGGMMS